MRPVPDSPILPAGVRAGGSFQRAGRAGGAVTPGGKLPRLLAEYPNVYADISAGSGHNALSRDAESGRRFIDEHWRKLLYGTDCYDTKHIDLLRSLELPAEAFNAITHDNAASIIPV